MKEFFENMLFIALLISPIAVLGFALAKAFKDTFDPPKRKDKQ